MKAGFVLYNGKFRKSEELLFHGNELFRLELGLKEAFRTEDNEILFFNANYGHIVDACTNLNFSLPEDFDASGNRLRRDVSRLLNKNKLYLASRVIVHLFPSPTGTDCLLTAEAIPRGFYPLNEKGLLVDSFEEGSKAESSLSSFEVGSRFLWSLAAAAAYRKGMQSMLIRNRKGFVCEAIGVSFGFIKNHVVYFPGTAAGGYASVLTGAVRECARLAGFTVTDINEIADAKLLDADELFLIDNCLGIQSVIGFRNRRYYNHKTKEIVLRLQEMARRDKSSTVDIDWTD